MSNEIGVRAVERAIAILDVLAQGGSRTGAEIARELHVHRSTALRLLGTLERHALVERDQRTARYRLARRPPQPARAGTPSLAPPPLPSPRCAHRAAPARATPTLAVPGRTAPVPLAPATA